MPLRCYQPVGNQGRLFCGAPAVLMRESVGYNGPGYFCEKHAREQDEPIPAERVFRRVQIIAEVLLAGASFVQSQAELDALARMTAALESVGGIVGIQTVSSQIGRLVARNGATVHER